MSEMKCRNQRNGALIRTMLTPNDLAELTRLAKGEGRSRSNFITRVLQEKIRDQKTNPMRGDGGASVAHP